MARRAAALVLLLGVAAVPEVYAAAGIESPGGGWLGASFRTILVMPLLAGIAVTFQTRDRWHVGWGVAANVATLAMMAPGPRLWSLVLELFFVGAILMSAPSFGRALGTLCLLAFWVAAAVCGYMQLMG